MTDVVKRTVTLHRPPRRPHEAAAGRQQSAEPVQALCFQAGANSIFYGDKLLTTGNPGTEADLALLHRLGLHAGQPQPRTPAP
jgi:biotin synthase